MLIAHAWEDKDSLVNELVAELDDLGVNPWYGKWTLRLGDHLRRRIDEGLARSRFGVVVLSHSFFQKQWPQTELDGLVMRESTGGRSSCLSGTESFGRSSCRYSPPLADRLVARASDSTVQEIAEEIAERLRGWPYWRLVRKRSMR